MLLAGEYPGARTEAEARAKLGILLDAGVRQFIDLTEAGEYSLRPYWPLVQQLAHWLAPGLGLVPESVLESAQV